jgi:dockerin type I repeat protein
VNSLDLVAIAAHLGNAGSPAYDAAFDINASGGVNSIDLMLTAQQFGSCQRSDIRCYPEPCGTPTPFISAAAKPND